MDQRQRLFHSWVLTTFHRLLPAGTIIRDHKSRTLSLAPGRHINTIDHRHSPSGIEVLDYLVLTRADVGPNAN